MKLIYCKRCGDIVKLTNRYRQCECSSSAGYYNTDGVHATVMGPCDVLGISNTDFQGVRDLHRMVPDGPGMGGWVFESWIIPENAATVRRINA